MRNDKKRARGYMGVNLRDDPSVLGDEEMVDGTNLWPDASGVLSTRPAMSHDRMIQFCGNVAATAKYYAIVAGIIPQNPNLEYAFIGIAYDPVTVTFRMYLVAGSGNVPNSTVQTVQDLGLVAVYNYQFFEFGNEIFVLGAPAMWRIKATTPAVAPTINPYVWADNTYSNHNTWAAPKLACIRDGRPIVANLGPGYEDAMVWGDRNNSDRIGTGLTQMDVWGDDLAGSASRLIRIGQGSGPITAMFCAANAPEAAPPQICVYVFKRNEMYTLMGEFGYISDTGPTMTGTLQSIRSNIPAGCPAQNTIVQTPWGLIWATEDDVVCMAFGQEPVRIGTKISNYMKKTPTMQQARWHAAYVDGAYRLALFKDGQGPTDYTPCGVQFWLDLREGLPEDANKARWFGPMVYNQTGTPAIDPPVLGTHCMVNGRGPDAKRLFTFQAGELNSKSGMVALCDLGSNDTVDSIWPSGGYERWQAGTAYAVGDKVYPIGTTANGGGSLVGIGFICTQAGTSGVSEPDWSTWPGPGYINDNGVFWTPEQTIADRTYSTYECVPRRTGTIPTTFIGPEWTGKETGLEELVTGASLTFFASQPLAITYNFLTDADRNFKVMEPSGINLQLGGTVPSSLSVPPGANITGLSVGRSWEKRFLPPDPNSRSRAASFQVAFTQYSPCAFAWETQPYVTVLVKVAGVQQLGTAALGTAGAYGVYATAALLVTDVIAALNAAMAAAGSAASVTLGSDMAVNQQLLLTLGADTIVIPFSRNALAGWDLTVPTDTQLANNRMLFGALGYSVTNSIQATGPAAYILPTDPWQPTMVSRVTLREAVVRYRTFRRNPL